MSANNFYKKISKNIEFQTYANICRRMTSSNEIFNRFGPFACPSVGFLGCPRDTWKASRSHLSNRFFM